MTKILVTPRSLTQSGHPALARLREAGYDLVFCTSGKQPEEDELLRLLPGCIGYLAGVERISARVLEAARELKVISRNGTGVDNIDLKAAQRLNIGVCTAPGANARGVAELTIALILALARSVPFGDSCLKRGEWDRRKGVEIRGKTLGVVGCGRIGKEVALMALGLGMKVLAFDVQEDRAFNPSPDFRYCDLDAVLTGADFVSLHAPGSDGGRPILDNGAIAKLRHGAYAVNTARASLVQEDAMLQALESGHVAGFATDVYAREPPIDSALLKHPGVIATPHVGGFTEEGVDRAVEGAADNLLGALRRSPH